VSTSKFTLDYVSFSNTAMFPKVSLTKIPLLICYYNLAKAFLFLILGKIWPSIEQIEF